jgi:hypothetical protein
MAAGQFRRTRDMTCEWRFASLARDLSAKSPLGCARDHVANGGVGVSAELTMLADSVAGAISSLAALRRNLRLELGRNVAILNVWHALLTQ